MGNILNNNDLIVKEPNRIVSYSPPCARISLRSSNNKFEDSGINVGQKGKTGSHVNINDCYVPIRSALIDQLPDLFPNKGINIKVGSGYGREAKKLTSNFGYFQNQIKCLTLKEAQAINMEPMNQYLLQGVRCQHDIQGRN